MLGSAALVGFVPSTDLDRARGFYEGALGLTVEDVNPYACVLRAGGTMLRITKVDQLAPQPFTVLGWVVADIARTAAQLGARGITFERFDGLGQDEAGVWTTPSGDKIMWFKDPDGNTLSLTQFS